MYELLFEAWAKLVGFTLTTGGLRWNGMTIFWAQDGTSRPYAFTDLVKWNVTIGQGNDLPMQNSIKLAELMTHASMILIFVFIIMFFVFLFRLVSGMLSGRR